ncbi:MAG: hypothetical protein ACF8PG_03505, partial [Maioricimonas sp. JB045]
MRRLMSAGWLISLLMAAAMAASAFITPGLRHQHEGGHAAHSHHHGSVSHSHGTHVHHHSHEPPARQSTSHIHLTLFGVELTIPNFMGSKEVPDADLGPLPARRPDGGSGGDFLLTGPGTRGVIVLTLSQIRLLRPGLFLAPSC